MDSNTLTTAADDVGSQDVSKVSRYCNKITLTIYLKQGVRQPATRDIGNKNYEID